MRYKSLYTVTLLSMAMWGLPDIAEAQTAAQYEFQISERNLGDALRQLAAQADLEVYAPAELVNNRSSPTLHGTMTVQEAVATLLQGSDLKADFAGGVIIVAARAKAGDGQASAAAEAQIIVTGSHIRGAQPIGAVSTTTRETIESQGYRDLGSYVRSIPQNFSGGQNPGVVGSLANGNENSSSSSALNLRGLGASATLTLLNGHRMAYDTTQQAIDISQIPLAAVDRIEILTDGASALYGSDAVAGVANVILRRSYEGLEATAHVSAPTDGGNFRREADILTGHIWGNGSIMLAGRFTEQDELLASDRDYTDVIDGSTTLLPWQKQYSVLVTGQQDLSGRLTFEFDALYNKRQTRLQLPYTVSDDVRVNGLVARPDVETFTLSSTLRWSLGPTWSVFASGTYGFGQNHIISRLYLSGSEALRIALDYDNDVASAEWGAEGPVFRLPGGDARLALGGGYRSTSLDVYVQQHSTTIDRVTSDIASHRDVVFAYGEIALPLVSQANALPAIDRLQLSMAGRFEKYPHEAQLFTPKLGLLYRPVPSVSVTAGWGKSFKTQTLYQQYQPIKGNLQPASLFTDPPGPNAVLELYGGNTGLKPEKATSWTVGVQWQPTIIPGLELRANWFDIRYRDRVRAPITSISAAFSNPLYRSFVTLKPSPDLVTELVESFPEGLTNLSGGPFDPTKVSAIIDGRYANVSSQHLEGVDIGLHYPVTLTASSSLLLDGDATHLTSSQELTPGSPEEQLAGTVYNPPRWRGRLSVKWDMPQFGLGIYGHYSGGLADRRQGRNIKTGDFVSFDLVSQWHPGRGSGALKGLEVTLGIENLFNAKPPYVRQTSPLSVPYDSTNYPATGRVVSATVRKAF